MGLKSIVSKHRDRTYTPGKCRHWMKTKNPAHPAYSRVTFASTCSRAFTPLTLAALKNNELRKAAMASAGLKPAG
jgi:ATP-dependent DNA ligase